MAFSIFFSITAILSISFASTKKKLHPFEIFFIWFVASVVDHNFTTVFTINLGMFDFSHQPANYWTLAVIRVFLTPLLIIWYVDLTLDPQRPYKKWTWLPLFILILVGLEYSADLMHVYRHVHWKVWWSFAEWFVIFLLVNYSWIWYRSLLKGEVI